MLATLPTPSHAISMNDTPMSPSAQGVSPITQDPASIAENKICPGCQKSVMNESGGVVIAFGQSFFHVECFQCAKCHTKVTADTNLLLLSDGQPVCSNCSYSCSVCHGPILDEAIMTGDDSYHAHCFKCRACHNRIDELMFAKTSHGIYCMHCHHERIARSRRHAQKQREREKSGGGSASGSSSTKSRDRLAKEQLRDNGAGTPPSSRTPTTAQTNTTATMTPESVGIPHPFRAATLPDSGPYLPSSPAPPSRRQSLQSLRDERQDQGSKPGAYQGSTGDSRAIENGQSMSRRPSVTVEPPPEARRPGPSISSRPSSPAVGYGVDELGQKIKLPSDQPVLSPRALGSPALLSPVEAGDQSLSRRRSFDSGMRTPDSMSKATSSVNGEGVSGLSIPSKGVNGRNKRHSINPGVALDLANFALMNGSKESSHGNGAQSPVGSLSRKSSQSSIRAPSRSEAPSNLSTPQSKPSLLGRMGTDTPQSHLTKRPSAMLDRVPPRTHSLATNTTEASRSRDRVPTLSSLAPSNGVRSVRSFDDRSARPFIPAGDRRGPTAVLTIDVEKSRRGLGTRSPQASPAHRVDVPRGVESGTDTDAEGDGAKAKPSRSDSNEDGPPLPPPKDSKPRARPDQPQLSDLSPDDSMEISRTESAAPSEYSEESSPVQRVSRSTFIAPALPPIRFSMNSGDFSDLLQSVNGRLDMKMLEQLAEASEKKNSPKREEPPKTPPPTAAADEETWKTTPTPTSVTTFTMSSESMDLSDATSVTSMATVSASIDHSSKPAEASSESRPASAPSSQLFNRTSSEMSSTTASISRSNSVSSSDVHSHPRAFPTSEDRTSSDLGHGARGPSPSSIPRRDRFDSSASMNPDVSVSYEASARITVTAPGSSVARPLKFDASDLVTRRLQEALHEASKRGAMHVNLDKEFIQAILMVVESRKVENAEMKGKLDGMKRASQQYMDGLTVAQGEYDRELNARRDAEAEVTRLRVLLAGQAARITAMSGDSRKDDLQKQLSQELSDSLEGLERHVSVLKVERDVAMAEVEELASSKSLSSLTDNEKTTSLGRSMTTRLDKLKNHYKRELVPLTEEREALLREIAELKEARDVFLEETTMLNARNEELAQLNALYARRTEAAIPSNGDEKRSASLDKSRPSQSGLPPSNTMATTSSVGTDESAESKFIKVQKPDPSLNESPATLRGKFRWRAQKEANAAAAAAAAAESGEAKAGPKHIFQQLNILRFTRCDHCGDKLWGSSSKCTTCNISVHFRCVAHVQTTCSPQAPEDARQQMPLLPSMFGRDLVEQVRADCRGGDRMVPVLVEKCIEAVEASAMEYEGIYRKTGGSSQSKLITQLFERGDYSSFDLRDTDRFNDICSVTSVLKTYFRSLPNPLLTFALHDEFMNASTIRDPAYKSVQYANLVKQLPTEHYYTLRMVMLHLHRVHQLNPTNLMTARNLGVVFGPTLMRSRDPAAEFSDMAGKALSVEWLIENASNIFPPLPNQT